MLVYLVSTGNCDPRCIDGVLSVAKHSAKLRVFVASSLNQATIPKPMLSYNTGVEGLVFMMQGPWPWQLHRRNSDTQW